MAAIIILEGARSRWQRCVPPERQVSSRGFASIQFLGEKEQGRKASLRKPNRGCQTHILFRAGAAHDDSSLWPREKASGYVRGTLAYRKDGVARQSQERRKLRAEVVVGQL